MMKKVFYSDIQEVYFIGKEFSYCGVCQEKYYSYSEHINSRKHQKNIRKNKKNKYIHKLCKLMNKKKQS